jgi:hypothetical protein
MVRRTKREQRENAKYQGRLEGMLRPQLLSAINKRQEGMANE